MTMHGVEANMNPRTEQILYTEFNPELRPTNLPAPLRTIPDEPAGSIFGFLKGKKGPSRSLGLWSREQVAAAIGRPIEGAA